MTQDFGFRILPRSRTQQMWTGVDMGSRERSGSMTRVLAPSSMQNISPHSTSANPPIGPRGGTGSSPMRKRRLTQRAVASKRGCGLTPAPKSLLLLFCSLPRSHPPVPTSRLHLSSTRCVLCTEWTPGGAHDVMGRPWVQGQRTRAKRPVSSQAVLAAIGRPREGGHRVGWGQIFVRHRR